MPINTTQCAAVIDDDSRGRESTAGLLASAGIDSHIFGSAEESLVAGQMEISCCLFSGTRRSGIDRWELQRSSVTNRPNLPIIYISAHQDDLARRRPLELSAVDLLYKPFDGEDLLKVVDSAVKHTRTPEEFTTVD
jgi:FixJ family two-component response regulator